MLVIYHRIYLLFDFYIIYLQKYRRICYITVSELNHFYLLLKISMNANIMKVQV